jgi:undecaprenyl-diphosphatase
MTSTLYAFDVALTHAVNGIAGMSAMLDVAMVWISAGGVPVLVLAVAGQWWRRADRRQVRHVLVSSGFAFLLGLALNQLILLLVQRVRPYDAGVTQLLIDRSADPSFPSDHATATAAIAAMFLLCRMPYLRVWFLLAAALVIVSRVYIGTHYVGDVLGGAVTGIVAALAVRLAYREGSALDRRLTGIL